MITRYIATCKCRLSEYFTSNRYDEKIDTKNTKLYSVTTIS